MICPTTATAGVPIVSPVLLRTHLNLDLASDYPIEDEMFRFRIAAEGLIPGTEFTTEIDGSVTFDSEAEAHESLTASIAVPYAGNWTVKITEGLLNPQHLFGSPFVVTVEPAPTDPAHCTSHFTSVVTAGTEFSASVQPKDAFLNPTDHADDSFYGRKGDDSDTDYQLVRSGDEFSYSKTLAAAGDYVFSVHHAVTNSEIAGSPFHYKVVAASPSAARTSHNIPVGDKGVAKKIESSTAYPLVLQVFPSDKYLNPIAAASGYKVVVSGLSDDLDDTYQLNSGTFFKTSIQLPKNLRTTIVLKFMYGSTVIGDGKEVRIPVSPPASYTLYYVVGLTFLAFAFFVKFLYDKYGKAAIERGEEKQVTAQGKLREVLTGKIRVQQFFLTIELIDAFSDLANGILKFLDGAGSLHFLLYYGFILLAFVSVPLGIRQILQRSRVKKGYRGMLTGTEEEVAMYAKALDETETDVTAQSRRLKCNFIVLELTVTELGIHGLMWEDAPSLLLNGVVIMLNMGREEKATLSMYASFISFGFSCVMTGRKMGLPSAKKALLVKKRDIEKAMRINDGVSNVEDMEGGGVARQATARISNLFRNMKTIRATAGPVSIVPVGGSSSIGSSSSAKMEEGGVEQGKSEERSFYGSPLEEDLRKQLSVTSRLLEDEKEQRLQLEDSNVTLRKRIVQLENKVE